jgi:hypothetical protein
MLAAAGAVEQLLQTAVAPSWSRSQTEINNRHNECQNFSPATHFPEK